MSVEGGVFTPAFTLTMMLVMGLLFGSIGVLVVSPIAVVIFILVKMFYVQDILGAAAN